MDYPPTPRMTPRTRRPAILPRVLTAGLALFAAAAVGCNPPTKATGPAAKPVDTPESLYRQARAIEDRVAASPQEAAANLQAARTAYIRALKANPPPKLEAYVRAGIGNVAFFQDDYKTAVEQWSAAYDRLDDANLKSMTLFRLGMAQQRMGWFPQADRTFLTLQQQFPQTQAAQLARSKQGARHFFVQLAVFSQPALADKAVNQLRAMGYAPTRAPDPQGRQVLRLGPLPTYAEALAAKTRLATDYPGAIISP